MVSHGCIVSPQVSQLKPRTDFRSVLLGEEAVYITHNDASVRTISSLVGL
jgi:hypothetical protein